MQHTSVTCLVLLYIFILTVTAWLIFSESEAACMVSTVKCWYVDLTVQFYWDGAYTVGWPSGFREWIVHWGAWVPGSKTPIQANCSGPGSFFSSCRAWYIWCCAQFEKKPYEADQVYLFFPNSYLMFIYQLTNIEFLQWGLWNKVDCPKEAPCQI